VTVFHLVRHGEHVLRSSGVVAGRSPGIGLSERGRAEIAAVGDRLAGEEIEALYASPMQRTRESAEILSARLGPPVELRDDLLELDFGEWTGLTFDQVRSDPRWQLWRNCRSFAAVTGGESMRQVQDRAIGALVELHHARPDGVVLIVSHGDVIRGALLFALGLPLDLHARIDVELASLSTVIVEARGMHVRQLNERPRL
jgi:broad specificity phosphatase PhoE